MSKILPNPSNIAEVISFLESINNPSELMECSAIIYASECNTKKKTLENYIRYNDISLENLTKQKNTLEGIIETAISNGLPVSDTTQQYMVDMKNLIDTKILNADDNNRIINLSKMKFLDKFQSDKETCGLVNIKVKPHTNIQKNMTNIFSKEFINAAGIIFIMHEIIDSDMSDELKKEIFIELKNKVCDTVDCQKDNPKFKDIPIRQCLPLIKKELTCIYKDKSKVCEDINTYMDELIEEVGFDPNPYNVYTLTPFDCGVRTVGSVIYNIASSETDKEVEEALILFSRLEVACEVYGEEIINEGEVSRTITRAVNKGANKVAHWKSPIKKGKEAVQRATDPISKMVNNWLNEIEDADKNERQEIVVKGGVVAKIGRLIRRAFDVTGGFILGGPVLAGIVFLGRLGTDKYMDAKTKKQVLQELEEELAIVNEKIDDSRGDENKQKKYELMRVRSKLENEIKRIKLNLKY